ncbi:helix-turn-helix domain-containing protein [Brevibacillus sp. NRS-1366]|uniref:helix-turn-helix domain-containing protein n=1 Tax=Brevibacillus sp. NRS-1366 TaxID=3233899 RepID=UPI003D2031C6
MFDRARCGKVIKELRQANNLQQEELAIKVGVKRVTISKIETGANAPSIELLYNICKHFNVSADYLLGLDNKSEE